MNLPFSLPAPSDAPPRRSRFRSRRAGFTIAEVMVAAVVLVLGISSAILALQQGMRAVDTARCTTLAAQIMQSQIEVLRLQNWAQINALTTPYVAQGGVTITEGNSGTPTALDNRLIAIADRFTFTRTITALRTDMRTITLAVGWNGVDGRPHSLRYELRYARNGLNDYLYVAH